MAGKNDIQEALHHIAGEILYDEPMSRHTSMNVGGVADALVLIENENQLMEVVQRLRERKIDFFPAGNLTNVIVRDGGYRGAILLMTGMKEVTQESDELISAQAGAALAKLVSFTATRELTGLEFCAGIPGSVGGAVWMNAGAYGKEMKDVLRTIFLLDSVGTKKTLNREEIIFHYRKTELPSGAIIMGAQFKLEKGERTQIKEKIGEIMKSRQQKHPLEYPNAGSIFKNLPPLIAGQLIEEMGMKGVTVGGAQISPKHANFIVNSGKATASDVLDLIALVQERAEKTKGVHLEPEVVIVGEDEC